MTSQNETKIGETLKLLREEKSLTQDEISEILNIKRQTYSAWERNVSSPDINTVAFLASFYGVTIDFLLGRTNARTYPHTQAAHIDEEGPPVTEDVLNQIEEIIKREREKIRREKEGR